MLNTTQYVEMRKEAYANDGFTPTIDDAPDLLLWDTTRYTDWQKTLIGGTALYTNLNASLFRRHLKCTIHRKGYLPKGNFRVSRKFRRSKRSNALQYQKYIR